MSSVLKIKTKRPFRLHHINTYNHEIGCCKKNIEINASIRLIQTNQRTESLTREAVFQRIVVPLILDSVRETEQK